MNGKDSSNLTLRIIMATSEVSTEPYLEIQSCDEAVKRPMQNYAAQTAPRSRMTRQSPRQTRKKNSYHANELAVKR